MMPRQLRVITAEFVGTAALLAIIVGSGIVTASGGDSASQLFRHAAAVGATLTVLIMVFGPVSGAHFNPAVTLVAMSERRISRRRSAGMIAAQILGGISGVMFANVTFARHAIEIASTPRNGFGILIAEAAVTAALIVVIFGLLRNGQSQVIGPAVGLLIGASIFGISSTAFANPAVAIARMFTDSFTGIVPVHVPGFLVAQTGGAFAGFVLVLLLFPQIQRHERVNDA